MTSRQLVWIACAALAAACPACGDNVAPVDVVAGNLTARIWAAPAQIQLIVDGDIAWQTQAGSDAADASRGSAGTPPHGFAAIGTLAVSVTGEFGAYKFDEDTASEQWRSIDRLGDIATTATGATFSLWSGGDNLGTGTLTFVTATRSGPDPDAAGFPRQVRLQLAMTAGDRVSLASPSPANEHLVGLGGQSWDVDHQGQTVPLWVQEDGIGKSNAADDDYDSNWFLSGRRHSTHSPMPMVVSSRGYALAVDSNARTIFALNSEQAGVARYETWAHTLDLQIFVGAGARDSTIAGDAARDALGNMLAWVGKPATPPASVFAPWVDAIFGSANVRAIAAQLRSAGISSSVIWTEDWRGGSDTSTGYAVEENWNVDRALYPDFEQLADDLHGEGFAFLVYNNTFLDSTGDVFAAATGSGYAIHDSTGASYSFTGGDLHPSSLLDLTNPAAVTWAKGVMGQGTALGADGWMADFGEWEPTDAVLASGEDALAVHNRYPVDWAQMTHDLLASTPAGRPAPLYFMRAAWIHSQPLVQVLWPGDQQTDFSDGDGFPSVIPMGIGLGLTGFPYFGSDIAGYMSLGTTPTTEELFYRWVTFGALSPVMRTHHGRSARDNFQWFHDDASIAHFRRWTRLHQQLAAYLTGQVGSFERDGLPLFRLTALEFPDDDWTWSATDAFMLGDRIFVAPVQTQGATLRTLQLPTGSWYPLLGGGEVAGTITVDAPLTEIPAFVPAGSMLVLYPDGVDTVNPAPALATATTLSAIGDDREVWLWPGSALSAARASWNDAVGVAGPAQWTWSGWPDGARLPTSATWNGAAVPIAIAGDGSATIAVVGDGTLALAGGGTLVIARGLAGAHVLVRLRA